MEPVTTRDRIMTAAMRLVSEKGYLGATTREIARDAGVTELTLFRHFGSKEQLFEELLSRNTFLPALKGLIPDLQSMPYDEALRTVGRRFLLSLKERKPMVKIMQAEMCRYPARMKRISGALFDEMLGTLAAYFTSLQRKKVFRPFPAELAARMFLGMLFSYFRTEEIMLGNDITKKGRMDAAVNGFVDLFLHGTLPAGAGGGKKRRPA
jgi:AcrR family transcriptional regulator